MARQYGRSRKTVSLDDDVVEMIRREMRLSGDSLQVVANRMLRNGLVQSSAGLRQPFRVKARPLGLPPELSYDCVAELLEQVEGLDRRG
jgi:hypothetical protein